jgi:ATP adenylyltransferase
MSAEEEIEMTGLQRLWATWRMKYISSIDQPTDGCVFCEILRSEDGPRNLVVHRGENAYIVLNLYPYNNGHSMVIPKRHVAELSELNDAERLEMMQLTAVLQAALEEGLNAQGFNVGMNLGRVAGAGIPGHLHLHMVPRWLGDTNFMPTVGETRVLPESLADTYAKVREAIQATLAREGTGA